MKRAMLAMIFSWAVLHAAPASAVAIGVPDTFTGGVLDNWFAGGGPVGQFPPGSPVAEPGGGPGGAADPFMKITSSGGPGAGGRLVVMNATQWAGDYTGIGGITMDVMNLGNTDLSLRLYLENPIPGPPTAEAVTLPSALIAAGSGWQSVFFSLAPSDLTVLSGSLNILLPGVTVLRLMHNTDASFPPNPIAAQLGVDNIVAVGPDVVPEPATFALVAAGGAMWLGRVRRRRATR